MGHLDMQGSRGSWTIERVRSCSLMWGELGVEDQTSGIMLKFTDSRGKSLLWEILGLCCSRRSKGLVCGRWQFGSGAPRVMGSGMWTSIGTEVVGDVELAVGEIVQGEGGEVGRRQALGLGAFSLLGMSA